MPPLSEDLTLNIQPALSAGEDLAASLTKDMQDAGASLADAVQTALSSLDPAPISAALSEAVAGADTTIAITPDTAELVGGVDAALASADATVTITPDTGSIPAEVEAAVTSADTTVPLSPDGSLIPPEIEEKIKESDTTVPLIPQLDPSEIEAQGQAAAQAVFEAQVSNAAGAAGNAPSLAQEGEQAVTAAAGVDVLATATRGLDTAQAGLEGSVGGVASALGPLGAGIAGVTGLTAGFFTEAVNEETALNRLNFVFGSLAPTIENVNLPASNFNQSLQEIAQSTGASLPGLEQANARIGSLGSTAGASGPQIAQTANQITALATYLAVTNPALGSASDIADQLTNALARGGRSAASLGISLGTAEIAAKAHTIATADGRDTVTQFDKVAAGAAITVNNLGGSLGDAVTKGSDAAALALPKLTEQLKETVAAVGTPLIGAVTATFTAVEPVLAGLATTIGHLLQAAAPLVVVLDLVLKALSALTDVINAIPIPVLTAAVTAFTAALVADKIITFATGLFTLGAAATEDVGLFGALGVAAEGLVATLGPVGIAIAAVTAAWEISSARAKSTADTATAYALSVAGVKSNTDLASESTGTLSQQLDAVKAKLSDLQSQGGGIGGFLASAYGLDDQRAANIKSLTSEAGNLQKALDGVNASAGNTSGMAAATKAAEDFATAMQTAASKADGVKTVLGSYATVVTGDVTKATGQATSVFADVGAATVSAAKAAENAASSTTSQASAMANAASQAKSLRDAIAAVDTAQDDLAKLAAGPTQDQIIAGYLSVASAVKGVRDAQTSVNDALIAQATLAAGPTAAQLESADLAIANSAKTARDAEQSLTDAIAARNALAAGPTGTDRAAADEAVAKAQLSQTQASLALGDARTKEAAIDAAITTTARQRLDANLATQAALFASTDATNTLTAAEAARDKLISDSLPGSAALVAADNKVADSRLALKAATLSETDAQAKRAQLVADSLPDSAAMVAANNKVADAELSLAQAVKSENDAITARGKLYSDALPGSDAYTAALQKVADAEDRLTQVQESNAAKGGAAAAKAAKTQVDALGDLQKGLDQQIAAENKFYADLAKIQSEGGLQIVAELLALGPKEGAAEASAVATATQSTVTALETKTETLKVDEDRHAQEISTVFATSLNANLVKAFSTQLRNETDFYANVQSIFNAGNAALAQNLLAQGPVQGAALAQAVSSATPQVQAALESQAQQLKTLENNAGQDTGKSYADGLISGIKDQTTRIAAAGALGGAALNAGATTALQSKSPSQLGIELGKNYGAGLVEGMQASVPLVVSTAASLASAMIVAPDAYIPTGTTSTQTGAVGAQGVVNQHVTVNEVANDPTATAFAVSSRLAQQAMR